MNGSNARCVLIRYRYQCKLCRGMVEVPREYFCHMDGQGSRADKYQRPELCCGTYEFIATPEYCRVGTQMVFRNVPFFMLPIN